MIAFRAGVFALASLALSFAWSAPARADVRTLNPAQTLARPAGQTYTYWGQDVAIDGGHIIVLAAYDGGHQALLYRRSNSTGRWLYRRALLNWAGEYREGSVVMKNGIAAVQIGEEVWLFELSGGDYVPATSAAPIRHHGGLAISGNRVLMGGNNCDYDAVVYQKNTAGIWDITGRLDDNFGACFDPYQRYSLELHYDYAILHAPYAREAQAWRRNGSALEWIHAGALTFQPDELVSTRNFALQGTTAVAANGAVFRRQTGTSIWNRQGELISVDRDNYGGMVGDVVYRDGVLLTIESGLWPFPRVYVESSPGQFDHVASLLVYDGTMFVDVSGRTAVAATRDWYSKVDVHVFNLPSQLPAPLPVVNDFEDRDASDFTLTSGQFALATRDSDDVLAQSSSTGLAIALLTDTDWTDHQRVEADITPTYVGSGSWVGLVARYVDPDNYYYLAIRDNLTYGIYKRVNGVDTLLYETHFYNSRGPTFRAMLRVSGNQIDVNFSFQQGATVTDNSIPRGRAGVATWMARADFDDVHAAGTDVYLLLSREYGIGGSDYEIKLEELSGDWQVEEISDEEESYLAGLAQRDTSGSAVAIAGTPVANQDLNARMQVDAFASSQQGAWFGLLARYVDARNHYYVTVRSTGQVQMRKIVNGVITVLGSASLTAVPGRYYTVRLLVINDQLQLYVDHVLVATAHDRDIASGRYGIATYRAAARWDAFWVLQP